MNGRKITNLTRVAFAPHLVGVPDNKGLQLIEVPAEYYPDQVARSFTIPINELRRSAEPKWLSFSHAYFVSSEIAVRLGIMGIQNPRPAYRYPASGRTFKRS